MVRQPSPGPADYQPDVWMGPALPAWTPPGKSLIVRPRKAKEADGCGFRLMAVESGLNFTMSGSRSASAGTLA